MAGRNVFMLAAMALGAQAATSVNDAFIASDSAANYIGLSTMYSPAWFFGQSQNQPPCIPTWAFSGSPSTPDTFDLAHQTKPGARCEYPNVGCNCRNPGVPIGNTAPEFPIYYSARQCNGSNIQIAYNLFYQKDGATFLGFDTGHDFDWERVIVSVNRDGSGNWTPNLIKLSQHSGYATIAWGSIQNTLTNDQASPAGADLRQNQAQQNLDHPKVYVAWDKHPNFDTRNTGFNDIASQSLDDAFRSQDWWFYVPNNLYIWSAPGSTAGTALSAANWGDASSNPPSVHNNDLCAS